ncbi:MAG: flagellar protein FlgN [Nocardioidaceae bacterium]
MSHDEIEGRSLMEKLSLILWRERELLETLLFKLEEERLLLASGRTRWLMRAAQEVETVLQSIRETEILRSVAADEAAASIGLGASPSLRALADSVGEPWHTILVEHRDAFVAVTQEITALADANREPAHRRLPVGPRDPDDPRRQRLRLWPGRHRAHRVPRHLLVDRSL